MTDINVDLSKNTYIDLNHNYLNNMLLVFIKDFIIQISLNSKEITTIYINDSPSSLFNESSLESGAKTIQRIYKEKIEIYSFYNYNIKLKKMQQFLLFKDIKANKIYHYFWEDGSLVYKEDLEFPNLIGLTEFDSLDNNNCENENPDKIFVYNDKIILFK